MTHNRRKSVDSSSSSSSSDSDSSHKKHKKDKKHASGHLDFGTSHASGHFDFGSSHAPVGGPAPPPYIGHAPVQSQTPPSGFRVPLSTTGPFPDPQQAGQPPCYDADGVSPIYVGSALFENSVHPCKIGRHLHPFVLVPYGGVEHGHNGRYDLLPFRPDQMEFVPTSHGRIPPGRRPVEGGYEDNGAKLQHAVAFVNGIRIPGKCGEHLQGCRVSFGGAELEIGDNYEILCWR
ncbi:hypothetical protein GALMADRAFT_247481 [Galerina marginata CBS 339.88]|uniref:Uncharacterized protein n=1 Tax=Galerina marginata (strain CBS 339.88) TaxID=685588 RepID=A0A067T1K7_GALM3|nr:hypothetical protein GALMADRAFT_247481 [Galerina marginata CBS 339.88]